MTSNPFESIPAAGNEKRLADFGRLNSVRPVPVTVCRWCDRKLQRHGRVLVCEVCDDTRKMPSPPQEGAAA